MDINNDITKKEKVLKITTYTCLSLSLVSTVTYMIYTIISATNIMDNILNIIFTIFLAILSILFILVGIFVDDKKMKIFLIISSLIISIFSIFQVIIGITTPKDKVLDFTGKDIKEVVSWAQERDILIKQVFKNSEKVEKYKIISQDVEVGTLVSKIDRIEVIVSDGFDLTVSTVVDSMIGWKLDDVIKYIDDNHLTNVTINFEFSNTVEKDTIISQDVISEIKRNEPITLISSLGKKEDLKSVTMDNLVGLDTFHALVYLGRNNLNYSLEYSYNENKEDGTILKQSIKKWEVIDPKDDVEVILTVAKKDKVTVADLNKMDVTEITAWATNNRLKIEITYEFDEAIKKDKIISSNYKKGSIIDVGSILKVIISKGQLRMIKFTTVDEFETWAKENNVTYDIDYEFNDNIKSGKLISSSHKENEIIKNKDTVKLVISQGGNTTIPNLIGMNKEEATSACKKANIICKYVYDNDNDNHEYNIVTKQSMRSGSNVPIDTTVTVTLGK